MGREGTGGECCGVQTKILKIDPSGLTCRVFACNLEYNSIPSTFVTQQLYVLLIYPLHLRTAATLPWEKKSTASGP